MRKLRNRGGKMSIGSKESVMSCAKMPGKVKNLLKK